MDGYPVDDHQAEYRGLTPIPAVRTIAEEKGLTPVPKTPAGPIPIPKTPTSPPKKEK